MELQGDTPTQYYQKLKKIVFFITDIYLSSHQTMAHSRVSQKFLGNHHVLVVSVAHMLPQYAVR